MGPGFCGAASCGGEEGEGSAGSRQLVAPTELLRASLNLLAWASRKGVSKAQEVPQLGCVRACEQYSWGNFVNLFPISWQWVLCGSGSSCILVTFFSGETNHSDSSNLFSCSLPHQVLESVEVGQARLWGVPLRPFQSVSLPWGLGLMERIPFSRLNPTRSLGVCCRTLCPDPEECCHVTWGL